MPNLKACNRLQTRRLILSKAQQKAQRNVVQARVGIGTSACPPHIYGGGTTSFGVGGLDAGRWCGGPEGGGSGGKLDGDGDAGLHGDNMVGGGLDGDVSSSSWSSSVALDDKDGGIAASPVTIGSPSTTSGGSQGNKCISGWGGASTRY